MRYCNPMDKLATIGERIKTIRERRNMTQSDLSDRSGVDAASLSRYENDHKKPTVETLLRIAQALDVGIEAIV